MGVYVCEMGTVQYLRAGCGIIFKKKIRYISDAKHALCTMMTKLIIRVCKGFLWSTLAEVNQVQIPCHILVRMCD